jgi:hypothetical protein
VGLRRRASGSPADDPAGWMKRGQQKGKVASADKLRLRAAGHGRGRTGSAGRLTSGGDPGLRRRQIVRQGRRAIIDFVVGPSCGCPVFDLRRTITSVSLDGAPLTPGAVSGWSGWVLRPWWASLDDDLRGAKKWTGGRHVRLRYFICTDAASSTRRTASSSTGPTSATLCAISRRTSGAPAAATMPPRSVPSPNCSSVRCKGRELQDLTRPREIRASSATAER